jgi:uncharacterized protein (DUF488 family)
MATPAPDSWQNWLILTLAPDGSGWPQGRDSRSLCEPSDVPPQLYTIGYEDHKTPASLTAALLRAGVVRLVDVRELPISRRKGFAKRALSEALADCGIAYEHDRALGNPKSSRDLYRSGQQDEGERQYLAHLRNGSSTAVDALATGLSDATTCLLCFEADHAACHRALIVEELRDRCPGLQVEHL